MDTTRNVKETSRQFAYPGEYRPPRYNRKKLRRKLLQSRSKGEVPSATIVEYPNALKMEIPAPGHRREDFIISLRGNNIHIVALKGREHFEYLASPAAGYFELTIPVPAYADTDFVRAEYHANNLCLWFQKTDIPLMQGFHRIIAY